MNLFTQIIIVLLLAIVSLSIYYGIKVKLLRKYYIKKRYLIVGMVLTLILPFFYMIFTKATTIPQWFSTIEMLLFTVIFLVFLEILKIDKINKNKPVIGKPKPNPNRAKNQK